MFVWKKYQNEIIAEVKDRKWRKIECNTKNIKEYNDSQINWKVIFKFYFFGVLYWSKLLQSTVISDITVRNSIFPNLHDGGSLSGSSVIVSLNECDMGISCWNNITVMSEIKSVLFEHIFIWFGSNW